MLVVQATQAAEPKTAIEQLTGRIRIMTSVSGMTRDDCHETIMTAKDPPTEEEFRLAYAAAIILNGGSNKTDPITQRVQCTSCDDKGCGFCVTGDSLAAHFPQD